MKNQWKRLEDQAAQRLGHLQEALHFFQFSTEMDDLVAWLQDAYRLVSSEDFGHDEYSTQSLLKKHRGVSDAIDKHRLHVVTLRKHMVALALQYRDQEVSEEHRRKMFHLFLISCVKTFLVRSAPDCRRCKCAWWRSSSCILRWWMWQC